MQIEANIDQDRLKAALLAAFGLQVAGLRFIPSGWIAYGYELRTQQGERYFLKLYEDDGYQPLTAGDWDFYLPLSAGLHAAGILPRIAYPLPRLDTGQEGEKSGAGNHTGREAYVAYLEGWRMLLFNFIEGQVLGPEGMTPGALGELGRMIGQLHRRGREVRVAHPLVEGFEVRFSQQMRAALAWGRGQDSDWQDPPGKTRGLRSMHRSLQQDAETLERGLERLLEMQRRLQARQVELVVCHTDLHGWNVMRDPLGQLWILDWENAMLAPREHDLFMFVQREGFEQNFWPGYLEAWQGSGQMVRLDEELLAFYALRRDLEDWIEFAQRLRQGKDGQTQDAEALGWMEMIVQSLAKQIDHA